MANLPNAETWPRIGLIVAEPGGGPPVMASIATPLDETGKIMWETLDPFFGQKGPKSLCQISSFRAGVGFLADIVDVGGS